MCCNFFLPGLYINPGSAKKTIRNEKKCESNKKKIVSMVLIWCQQLPLRPQHNDFGGLLHTYIASTSTIFVCNIKDRNNTDIGTFDMLEAIPGYFALWELKNNSISPSFFVLWCPNYLLIVYIVCLTFSFKFISKLRRDKEEIKMVCSGKSNVITSNRIGRRKKLALVNTKVLVCQIASASQNLNS